MCRTFSLNYIITDEFVNAPIYGSDRIGQVAYEEEIYWVPFNSNLQETALSFNLDKREGISGYKNWIKEGVGLGVRVSVKVFLVKLD